ncbi:dihydroorotase [Alkaliphilus sp. MSJ-5]|uniref:Dihydroorotase n=1 Tax=Alkaliphilus flagellatus TaxID=2841507 RepID=A0ABS6FXC1_9FIRM|nr:dihydroorotase [Alkaliphilus flagellatus]MBU5674877.1 dihydroorotase [Alkaliphilus flagellatus]
MKLLIKSGRVINPSTGLDEIKDILLIDGLVAKIEDEILDEADKIIDAMDFWVTPGLIDLHVHLREPGFEHKETIETGSRSAAKGGFTTICCMPNTNPAIDCKDVVDFVKSRAREKAIVNVLPIGSITKGLKGEELANIDEMVKIGICAISDDGRTVQNSDSMRQGMKIAKDLNIPVFSHCEDETLLCGGVMNSGAVSKELGMDGILSEVENVIIARDIVLTKGTGAKLHICHISTSLGVDLLRFGKSIGANVTGEVCPHHFTLTDKDVSSLDTNMKMNPPLRGQDDVEAIKMGLKDGTIDVIATDHAPHHKDEKSLSFSNAPFGIVGLETAIPLGITELVKEGWLTPMELIEKFTINPAKILDIDKGDIGVGKIADITIINPSVEYKIDVKGFASKSKNSPFHNRLVNGRVEYTIVNGEVVYDRIKDNK